MARVPAPDTIAAIATPPGRGGIGVVRVSGPRVPDIARGVLGRLPRPRYATLAEFRDARGQVMDQGLALYFVAPHSYTGEDVLELHGHGGPAVLHLLLGRCLELGARLAEPGEFTRRAFLNDKLDLAQAEAVADLIDAASAQAARSAARSLSGEFSRAVNALGQRLVELRMLVEASLDFPEEDIDFLATADVATKLAALAAELEALRRRAHQGRLLQEGLTIVLVGQPNVGKSSLLNRLAGEEIALVTPVPGTTRDTVRERILVEGIPLHVIDTAGLRETEDEVERLGQARTWAAVEKADLVLVIADARAGLNAEEAAITARLPPRLPVLTVYNKIDLTGEAPRSTAEAVWLSALTGAGIDFLHERLLAMAGWEQLSEDVLSARERHLAALRRAEAHVAAAAQVQAPELLAEELRLAQEALGEITGEFTADDLLGEIFARFCIGK